MVIAIYGPLILMVVTQNEIKKLTKFFLSKSFSKGGLDQSK